MNRADRSAATVRSAYRIVRSMAGSSANVNDFLLGRDNGEGQGVSEGQLQVYLDEFVFRHNLRRQPMAASLTLLGLGAGRAPTPYDRIRGAADLTGAGPQHIGSPETTG